MYRKCSVTDEWVVWKSEEYHATNAYNVITKVFLLKHLRVPTVLTISAKANSNNILDYF